jgi:hypothetical protein
MQRAQSTDIRSFVYRDTDIMHDAAEKASLLDEFPKS